VLRVYTEEEGLQLIRPRGNEIQLTLLNLAMPELSGVDVLCAGWVDRSQLIRTVNQQLNHCANLRWQGNEAAEKSSKVTVSPTHPRRRGNDETINLFFLCGFYNGMNANA